MARRIESHAIPGPVGMLEALLEEPDDIAPHTAALICHPHPLGGGTMHNKVVYRMARALRRAGCVVLRFNFRGVGKSEGTHGNFTGEVEDGRVALDWLRARYPDLPFALAGFSFGARAITRVGCAGEGARWMIAAGFPTVQGPCEYLESCALPKTFILSTHDQYAPRADFEEMYARWAEPKRLEWIEAADHFFAGALDQFEDTVARSVRC
jgi:alpha/beta superfamily hydrolase